MSSRSDVRAGLATLLLAVGVAIATSPAGGQEAELETPAQARCAEMSPYDTIGGSVANDYDFSGAVREHDFPITIISTAPGE